MSSELVVTKRFINKFINKTAICYKTHNRLHGFKVLFVYFLEVLQMTYIFDYVSTFM